MKTSIQSSSTLPSIAEYFSEKTVALTGASGFLGQLLIEKLLRSCPNIKKILLFIRNKKGVTSEERLKKITQLPIFDTLRSRQPQFSSKLVVIPCDLEKEDFDLSDESYQFIIKEVNFFFHSAATLSFTEHLRLSFEINTLGVRRMLKLCRNIVDLKAIIHISTAYSFCNREIIDEEVYQTGWDYDKLHDAMQWMSDDMITQLTPHILRNRPNTYTLTKAFGEEIIVKEGVGLPICIVRPSIIGSTYMDPTPGWCINVNGPTGLFIAFGKGFLRYLNNDKESHADIIPADYVINGIIAAAWKTGLTGVTHPETVPSVSFALPTSEHSTPSSSKSYQQLHTMGFIAMQETQDTVRRRKSIPIYHLVANTGSTVSLSRICSMVGNSYDNFPLDNALRYPDINSASNKYLYRALSFFSEYLPAVMLDVGLVLIGRKPKLLKIMQRVSSSLNVLSYFFNHAWIWHDRKATQLQSDLSVADRKEFFFNPDTIDWDEYIQHYCVGTKKYILKEDPEGYPAARRHMWRTKITRVIRLGGEHSVDLLPLLYHWLRNHYKSFGTNTARVIKKTPCDGMVFPVRPFPGCLARVRVPQRNWTKPVAPFHVTLVQVLEILSNFEHLAQVEFPSTLFCLKISSCRRGCKGEHSESSFGRSALNSSQISSADSTNF